MFTTGMALRKRKRRPRIRIRISHPPSAPRASPDSGNSAHWRPFARTPPDVYLVDLAPPGVCPPPQRLTSRSLSFEVSLPSSRQTLRRTKIIRARVRPEGLPQHQSADAEPNQTNKTPRIYTIPLEAAVENRAHPVKLDYSVHAVVCVGPSPTPCGPN